MLREQTRIRRQVVKLEIVPDKDTGLTLNIYKWFDGKSERWIVEVANRWCGSGGGLPFQMLAWDEKIDGELAEAQRKAMEYADL